MAGFVQIIEYQTSRIDEMDALIAERRASGEPMPMVRAMATADRDRPNTYLSIIEFESYEQAMENSNRPDTHELAQKMAALCDGPAKFYNLDVRATMEP
jgi:hypothetical protein